jgi:hypothetical protein
LKALLFAVAAVLIVASTSAVAQDGDSPTIDNSGKGAVLCLMHMLVGAKASAGICKWARTPADDVIENGLSDIAAFAVANSSRPVTREQFDYYVKSELKIYSDGYSQDPGYCTADPKNSESGAALPWMFHTMEPKKLRAAIADTLSIPREPLLNPCL